MIFFWAETPDGWGIPGIHGPFAEDELDGYVQSGVYLIRGKGENLLIDSGNWTLPEYNNGMGDFLVEMLDREKNELKYIFVTHFHYDHVGNALMLKKRYGATVVCHPFDRPIIEDPMLVTRRENITRFGTTPEAMLEDFNLETGRKLRAFRSSNRKQVLESPCRSRSYRRRWRHSRCRRLETRGRSLAWTLSRSHRDLESQ